MGKILVVEDQPEVQKVVVELLELSGHDVKLAENGHESLKLLKEHQFELVVTDIIMPGMTGLTLIKNLRKDYPNIKVLAVSGGGRISSEDYLKTAVQIGADKILRKPFDLMELSSVVDSLLGG